MSSTEASAARERVNDKFVFPLSSPAPILASLPSANTLVAQQPVPRSRFLCRVDLVSFLHLVTIFNFLSAKKKARDILPTGPTPI